MLTLLWASVVLSDETATTHRPGDVIPYNWGCHDVGSVIAIAKSDRRNELGAVLQEQGKCFMMRYSILAGLQEWVAGPFEDENRNGTGSVWRVLDQLGDTEFVWLNDAGGRHAAFQEMAL